MCTRTGMISPGPSRSSLRFRRIAFSPSFGYDLGGISRRAGSADPVLGDSVSRFYLKSDSNIQFWRVLTLAATDTSYFLPPATRRQFRNYLEARTEVNVGSWTHSDFFGLQDAIVFKFQRGEQPPTFNPVNSLSLGFKIYR
jgi:hypothetical protein